MDGEPIQTPKRKKTQSGCVSLVGSRLPSVENSARFSAYYVHATRPGSAPHDDFATTYEYEAWLSGVKYRSAEWKTESDKHMSSSKAGDALYGERYKNQKTRSEYSLYILERGYHLEPLHVALLTMIAGDMYRIVRCVRSYLHRTERDMLATPDAFIVDAMSGAIVGIAEFKSHGVQWPRNGGEPRTPIGSSFKTIDRHHMCQVQFAMQVVDQPWCLLSSLTVCDRTKRSAWTLHSIKRSDAFWSAMLPRLRKHCEEVISANTTASVTPTKKRRAPDTNAFIPPPVDAEMVLDATDVIDMIDRGHELLATAINRAHASSRELFAAQRAGSVGVMNGTGDA